MRLVNRLVTTCERDVTWQAVLWFPKMEDAKLTIGLMFAESWSNDLDDLDDFGGNFGEAP